MLIVDGSSTGISGIVTQRDNDKTSYKIIAYASSVTFWVLVTMVSSRHTCNSTLCLGLRPRPNEELTTENDP